MRWGLAAALLASCGDPRSDRPGTEIPRDASAPDGVPDDAGPDAQGPVDAAPDGAVDASGTDAAPPNIVAVPCAGATIARTVLTSKSDYYPEALTISVGEIVQFMPLNPHDVVAGTFAAPQPWFMVQGNTTGCVRFDEAGQFPFFCTAHPFSMTGQVTVVP